ncbi:Protein kinase domain [Trypanosoma melophagium]|uniref:Protein kinase domain n=1 Tax=Trypanosoma melophagium TaxID=715481 RepID=UPI00351A3D8D|nr:Protein kinase domain [Trypanosoma melophagium]
MSLEEKDISIGSDSLLHEKKDGNGNHSTRMTQQQLLQRCVSFFPFYALPPVPNGGSTGNRERGNGGDENDESESKKVNLAGKPIQQLGFLPSIIPLRKEQDIKSSSQKAIESRLQLVRVIGGGVSGVIFFATAKTNHKQMQQVEPSSRDVNGRMESLKAAALQSPSLIPVNKNAEEPQEPRHVAVKFIDLEGEDEMRRLRVLREAKFLRSCCFFSILRCYREHVKHLYSDEIPNKDKNPVIAVALELEYANNGDLRDEVKTRIQKNFRLFSERDALLIFLQILMAVHYLHKRGIIHRDIKTANVLLCSNGLIKVADFGFSKQLDEDVNEEVNGSFVGTPCYLSPEIWLRKPYGKKVDVFSLGVLLYELLTLKRPFGGESIEEIKRNILNQNPEIPDFIHPDVAHILRLLLDKDSKRRPSVIEVLSLPLMRMMFATFRQCVLRDGLTGSSSSRPGGVNGKNQTESVSGAVARGRVCTDSRWRLGPVERHQVAFDLEQVRKDILHHMLETSSGVKSMSLLRLTTHISGDSAQVQIVLDGILQKENNGCWKRRYLCLQRTPLEGKSSGSKSTAKSYDIQLLLALKKGSDHCVCKCMSEFIDCFPVPQRYSMDEASYVFTLVSRVGNKVTFQAFCEEERQKWVNTCLECIEYYAQNESSSDTDNSSSLRRGSYDSFATLQTCSTVSAWSEQMRTGSIRSNLSSAMKRNLLPVISSRRRKKTDETVMSPSCS